MTMRAPMMLVAVVLASFAPRLAMAQGPDSSKAQPHPTWYRTQPIDTSFVEQKETMALDADQALTVFDESENRIAGDWQAHLPQAVSDADRVSSLPEADGIATCVKARQPLRIHILGFDKDRVHLVLARHVGNYLWHWYYAVEADFMVERSDEVDERLGMSAFAEPFTRSVRGIRQGDTQKRVHEKLGPPDAQRHTQAQGLFWEYYFDEDITIEYYNSVFKITAGVPKVIRSGKTDTPLVTYPEAKKTSDDQTPASDPSEAQGADDDGPGT